MSRLVLAGDVGGTKANLALFEEEGGRLSVVREATLPSPEYPGVTELVRSFLGAERPPRRACFGIPGPVREGRTVTPNLPWTVDAEEIARALDLPSVTLVNDLQATASGIGELPHESFAALQAGGPNPNGNAALIAAGTGLGEAILFRHGRELVPSASEGGHADFAPTDEVQVELFRFLAARFGRVSFERVVSGPGLENVYRFLVETGRRKESPSVAARIAKEDPPAVIAETGMKRGDPACADALELFVRVYGAEAGNLALKALASAGLYVGGGIAPKILPKLREGGFLEAFRNKGRLSDLLAGIPVRVILDPKTALYGAARLAAGEKARA